MGLPLFEYQGGPAEDFGLITIFAAIRPDGTFLSYESPFIYKRDNILILPDTYIYVNAECNIIKGKIFQLVQ